MESRDLVSGFMFRFRRIDAHLRNQWSNYTNWPYKDIIPQATNTIDDLELPNPAYHQFTGNIGSQSVNSACELLINDYPVNQKNILLELGITMDGVYREKLLDAGVFQYLEKYMLTTGGSKDGLYCYNFCLDSN